jgi:2-C-methyl-D-erythritol 4-phosphate cytidylyltransferase
MNYALIVAAGQGKRMGIDGGKQFLTLMGKPSLAHTLIAFQNALSIDKIVIVTTADSFERCLQVVTDNDITKFAQVIEGGKERMDSVYNGLKVIQDFGDAKNVAIHDGARPLIEPAVIDEVVDTVNFDDDNDGAIVGTPAVDTVKLVRNGFVVETPDRNMTWQIQTPQVFPVDLLVKAHEEARLSNFLGTDDSVLVERTGGRVKVVEGSRENLKITTPEDLLIAESILNKRAEAANSK